MKSLACTFVCLLLAVSVAHAQGVGSSGEITGTVTDPSGAVLPNVTVNVVDNQTGLKRTAMTNGTGQFRVARLSPATYDVSVERPGFATEIRRSVTVAIGQTVISDFKVKPSQVATVVEVTDQPPVVETERGSQADRISQQYITDLPIDRRDYLTFTLLAPGVSDSTRLAGDQDFRVKQTPTKRPVVLRQQWKRKQRHGGRWRDLRRQRRAASDRKPGRRTGIPDQSQQLRRGPGFGYWRFYQHCDQVGHQQCAWQPVWFFPQRCNGRPESVLVQPGIAGRARRSIPPTLTL